jgi:NADPH-dependent 2,4-dienoyl-CoA reductase/sulfur reductase-like enzyme
MAAVRRRGGRRLPFTDADRIVVVGAGRAGLAAAETLRENGYGGEVLLLGDEATRPYDRTACSKGILSGRQRPVDVALKPRPGIGVTYALGRSAVDVDLVRHNVRTDDDRELGYDGLVVASGCGPSLPAEWPIGAPGFHVLYGLWESWSLRHDLRWAERVAIVGGGLSGCEAAYTIRNLAREVVLIDSNPGVMTRAIGGPASEYMTAEVRRDGIELHLGRRVQGVEPLRRGFLVTLSDGSEVMADIVVAALGERPNVDWMRSSEHWDISEGVLCDESLRVVGVPNVVAAGSVARWRNVRFGTPPARCGQWIAALETGQIAARTLLAGDEPAEPAAILPRYWSEQFGLRVQVCGQLSEWAEISVTHLRPGARDPVRSGIIIGYSLTDQLVGLVAINAPYAFTSIAGALMSVPHEPVPPGIRSAAPALEVEHAISGLMVRP